MVFELLKIVLDILNDLDFFIVILIEQSSDKIINLGSVLSKGDVFDRPVVNDEPELALKNDLVAELPILGKGFRHDSNQHVHHVNQKSEGGNHVDEPKTSFVLGTFSDFKWGISHLSKAKHVHVL
jgi:hypothetical protein